MSYNESLRSNSNYPPMPQSQWDAAPWNQKDVPEKEFEVICSQTLSKAVPVTTNNYNPIAEKEYDAEEGSIWNCYDDTSETNWKEEYSENDYHTPLQLISLFKEVLKGNLSCGIVYKSPAFTEALIKECEDWEEDEWEVIQN